MKMKYFRYIFEEANFCKAYFKIYLVKNFYFKLVKFTHSYI